MLVVELLEDVGLELLVLADGLEDLLALVVGGRLDEIGDLRRVQACQAPRGEPQPRAGDVPTNGSISSQGTNYAWSPRGRGSGAGGSGDARAEARVDSGDPPGAVDLTDELDLTRRDQARC